MVAVIQEPEAGENRTAEDESVLYLPEISKLQEEVKGVGHLKVAASNI